MELSHTIWDEKIDKFICTLNLWKMRDLSLKGKKTVINILASSADTLEKVGVINNLGHSLWVQIAFHINDTKVTESSNNCAGNTSQL